MNLLCFGFGYSARHLVERLSGWRIAATYRRANQREELRARGVEAVPFDDAEAAIDAATHILASAPPDEAGDPVLRRYAAHLAKSNPRWIGYLSTTSVYGDQAGGWVDETMPVQPTTERGRRRAAAEAAWRDLQRYGAPVHLFRLPGIYGAGRNAVDALRNGKARRVEKPGHVFSRIHVEDLASALHASMQNPQSGAVYNVCDDAPASAADVVAFAAELLGVAPPPPVPFAAADLSPATQSFYADSKRVRNDRIKRELGVTLRYPTYREGLRAVAASI